MSSDERFFGLKNMDNTNELSFTVYLGNLPTWVTTDDVKQWLVADGLADSAKAIVDYGTGECRGFAFIEARTAEDMHAIIGRYDYAPLEDRIVRASQKRTSTDAPVRRRSRG